MDRNEALVRDTRDRIGADGQIMLDCYMGWDEPYTIEMAGRLQQYRVRWIEDPSCPSTTTAIGGSGISSTRGASSITGGEHEFTRYGFREMIEKQAVDIIQPDIGRAGGVSEVRKICAWRRSTGFPSFCTVPVLPAYHVAVSTPNCPCAEYIDMFAGGGTPYFTGEPQPKNGQIELSEAPGFGYELNGELLAGKPPAPIW